MVSVIEKLRQNDPDKTAINIVLRDETSDADLAQALEQNPFVTTIRLDVEGEQRAEWNSLLHVIATRDNLEKVLVGDRDRVWADLSDAPAAPAALVPSILQAIQQNTAIQNVDLWSLRLPTNIALFVNTASSIKTFSLCYCDMEPAEREQGASSLAAALQRNRTIESLHLSRLKDIYTISTLEGLRSNAFLKTLIFSLRRNESGAIFHGLQRLLESTTSIKRLDLDRTQFRGDMFQPISQGIINSESVSELEFSGVKFHGRKSLVPLQSILQNKRNLASLCLNCCSFKGGQVHEDIISILLQPDSLLRSFEFESFEVESFEDEVMAVAFSGVLMNLLRAIEKIKLLERLKIGTIRTQHQLQTLTQTIPSMKLKELEIDFWYDDEEELEFVPETIRQELLHAVKNNFSLRAVKAEMFTDYDQFDLFDSAEDKHSLAFYANRNESLDQWVDHPEKVKQQKVWPEALGLAERAGPSALFRGLHSVLERDYVIPKGGRKRKRPQYYTPV